MIPTTRNDLYTIALQQLAAFKNGSGGAFKGRFIQIFLALKFYQNQIPSMHSGQFMLSDVLQTLLDDLYAKASRASNSCVLMLFEGTYRARTGIVGVGNIAAQNTWRNNLNIQKGIGCYAQPALLASQVFLDQPRVQCIHLRATTAGVLAGASCELCPTGRYRNEEHRKWLRIDPGGNGYAAVDPINIANFSPYVVPNGNRLPAIPMILALYFDGDPGLVVGRRPHVSILEFMADFNFSFQEFVAYFDDDPLNPFNAAVIAADPAIHYTRGQPLPALPAAPAPAPVPAAPVVGGGPPVAAIPPPVLTGTVVTPPAVNSGWGAQQYAKSALEAAGWIVHDVSRQQLGYDLLAKRGMRTIYVEVKSSLSLCTPSLTSREWFQAKHHHASYVLAVVENFEEAGPNTVYWVVNPANTCSATQSTSVSYGISRSVWQRNVYPIASL